VTSGTGNVAVGNDALTVSTASNNTAVGYQAGYSNTTGLDNVAIGYQSLFTAAGATASYSTAVGHQAGYATTTGNANTFLGYGAGFGLTTGIGNTFVGPGTLSGSGGLITTGSKNTILGAFSGNSGGLDIRTASNHIVLSDGDGNPRAYWNAAGALTTGNIVLPTAASYILLGGSNPAVNAYIQESSSSIILGSANTPRMTLDASGNLLVGNTTSFSVAVRGQFAGASNGIYISSTSVAGTSDNLIAGFHTGSTTAQGTLSFAVATNGNVINTNNSYGAISDIKLKENITDATPKLAGINQVRVVNYNLISSPDVKQLGVVAQELEQIFPGMVDETPDRDEDGNDLGTVTKSVKYSVFVPMLIKAMQEQQAIIDSLTARLDALEGAN
jgi:trimeric autotransporter adhesin